MFSVLLEAFSVSAIGWMVLLVAYAVECNKRSQES